MDGKNSSLDLPTIAIAGNPNAGKTTLFNALTGLKHKVANYPDVTVERTSGTIIHDGAPIRIDELPGLYSMNASSIEEQIAREMRTRTLNSEFRPDSVIAVVDATNLERNLYLVTHMLELKSPMVIALTMIDVLEKR